MTNGFRHLLSKDFLETMVRYIINARDDMSYTGMHEAVKNVSPKGGELLMTMAEKLAEVMKLTGLERRPALQPRPLDNVFDNDNREVGCIYPMFVYDIG